MPRFVRIAEEKCTGCEVCVLACPVDVLRFDATRRRAFTDQARLEDCTGCLNCEQNCPDGAIECGADRTTP